jgi:anti-sigma regulatory factor (Ser/Thr protein kinase)
MMIAALYTRLPRDTSAPARARRALSQVDEVLDDDVLRDASILITELVANAVRHSYAGDTVELAVTIDEATVRTEVRERAGAGFEPTVSIAPPKRESGRGLYLVDAVSERWGVARGKGVCVWFELGQPRGVRVARCG